MLLEAKHASDGINTLAQAEVRNFALFDALIVTKVDWLDRYLIEDRVIF